MSLPAHPTKADHGLDKTREVDRSLGNLVDGCLITASYGSVIFSGFPDSSLALIYCQRQEMYFERN